MKTCSSCKQLKIITEFDKNRSHPDGLHNQCKECKRKWKPAPGSRSDYHRDFYLRNRERVLKRQKERQLENKEAYLAYRRQYHKKYFQTVKGRLARQRASSSRRALLRGVDRDRYTIEQLYERDGGHCAICQEAIDKSIRWPKPGALTVEHRIPIALGGSDTLDNVTIAHFSCNLKDSNKIRIKNAEAKRKVSA